MSKSKPILCPTCKQNMRCAPRESTSGKDCPQCGQGMTTYRADKMAAGQQEQEDDE